MNQSGFFMAAILIVSAGCAPGSGSDSGSDPDSPATPRLPAAALTVTPGQSSLVVPASLQLQAVFSEQGVATPATIVWSSIHPEIAEISLAGRVTARAAGGATIRATVAGRPEITAEATVTVYESGELIGRDFGRLLRFPAEGGVPIDVDFAPDGLELVRAMAPVPGGLYILTESRALWFVDFILQKSTHLMDFTTADGYISLGAMARAPDGDLVIVDATNGRTYRVDLATKAVTRFIDDTWHCPGGIPCATIFDAAGNLLVLGTLINGTYVHKVSPAGAVSPLVTSPFGETTVATGIAFHGGSVFISDVGADVVLRYDDNNGNGVYDGSEARICFACEEPGGLIWNGDSLLVNAQIDGVILRLTDLSGDGLFLDGAERTTWSTTILPTGYSVEIFEHLQLP